VKEERLIYNPQTSFRKNEPTDVGLGIKPKSTVSWRVRVKGAPRERIGSGSNIYQRFKMKPHISHKCIYNDGLGGTVIKNGKNSKTITKMPPSLLLRKIFMNRLYTRL